jgi:hypothetical protein
MTNGQDAGQILSDRANSGIVGELTDRFLEAEVTPLYLELGFQLAKLVLGHRSHFSRLHRFSLSA